MKQGVGFETALKALPVLESHKYPIVKVTPPMFRLGSQTGSFRYQAMLVQLVLFPTYSHP